MAHPHRNTLISRNSVRRGTQLREAKPHPRVRLRRFRSNGRPHRTGPRWRRARVLQHELGIATLHDLAQAAAAHRIRELHGFGAQSESRLLDAVTARLEHHRRYGLVIAKPCAEALTRYLLASGTAEQLVVAGSYRIHSGGRLPPAHRSRTCRAGENCGRLVRALSGGMPPCRRGARAHSPRRTHSGHAPAGAAEDGTARIAQRQRPRRDARLIECAHSRSLQTLVWRHMFHMPRPLYGCRSVASDSSALLACIREIAPPILDSETASRQVRRFLMGGAPVPFDQPGGAPLQRMPTAPVKEMCDGPRCGTSGSLGGGHS